MLRELFNTVHDLNLCGGRVIEYSQLVSFLLLNVGIHIKGVQKHQNSFKYDLVLDLRKWGMSYSTHYASQWMWSHNSPQCAQLPSLPTIVERSPPPSQDHITAVYRLHKEYQDYTTKPIDPYISFLNFCYQHRAVTTNLTAELR